ALAWPYFEWGGAMVVICIALMFVSGSAVSVEGRSVQRLWTQHAASLRMGLYRLWEFRHLTIRF
ncbi:MAG: hypothetical protein AB4911_19260, partial [Oscillochloridaceae bacterium umkhey_bin13]